MSCELIKKRTDGMGNLVCAIYKITLPADGSWTDAIDVFGFKKLCPMIGEDEVPEAYFEVSADAITWAMPNDESGTMSLDTGHHYQTVVLEVLDRREVVAPYIRFQATDNVHRGKSFYFYCL